MTLHTNAGPIISNSSEFLGDAITLNCDVKAPNQPMNAGCSIGDNSNLTFGPEFNDAGGGVFATEWTSDFIKIWFFPRGSFPSDIVSSSPNPSKNWGTPNSLFQGPFNIDDHFKNLSIIFDTTFCGQVSLLFLQIPGRMLMSFCFHQWAGAVWNSSACGSLAPTCEEYVANNPADFVNAYWAVNTLQVFQDDGTAAAGATASTTKRAAGGHHAWRDQSVEVRSGKRILPIY